MSYERLNLKDGQVLTGANIKHIEDGIEEALRGVEDLKMSGGSGSIIVDDDGYLTTTSGGFDVDDDGYVVL